MINAFGDAFWLDSCFRVLCDCWGAALVAGPGSTWDLHRIFIHPAP